jgi:hypothetical protein
MNKKFYFTLKESFLALTLSFSILALATSVNLISKQFNITRIVLFSIVYTSYVLHILIYLIDLPFVQTFLSLSILISIHRLLLTFPIVNVNCFFYKYSFTAFLINNFLMFIYFIKSKINRSEKITVYIICSITPITFFLYQKCDLFRIKTE